MFPGVQSITTPEGFVITPGNPETGPEIHVKFTGPEIHSIWRAVAESPLIIGESKRQKLWDAFRNIRDWGY